MPNWDLEIAAEDLRRYAPDGWAKFMQALDGTAIAAMERLMDAPPEQLQIYQGEARTLRNLCIKLANAADTAQRLKAKDG